MEDLPPVCLFCVRELPPKWEEAETLERRAPTGRLLSVNLLNRQKNEQSFNFLCEVMGVGIKGWWRNTLRFKTSSQLPLCYECQGRYQEMWQLRSQVKLLEELIGRYAESIRESVRKTERRGRRVEGTQLAALGLNLLRRLIVNPWYKPTKKSDYGILTAETEAPPRETRTLATTEKSHTDAATEDVIIKEEVHPQRDILGEDWMDDDDSGDANPLSPEEPEPSPAFDSSRDADDNKEDIPSMTENPKEHTPRTTRSTRNSKPVNLKDLSDEEMDEDEVGDQEDTNVSEEDLGSSASNNDDDDSDFEEPRPKRRSAVTPQKSRQRTSTSKRRVPDHIMEKLVDREYECHLCSAVTIGYHNHTAHYEEEHPGEKRYTCNLCGKYYPKYNLILIHVRKHRGERPLKCSHCPKAFGDKRALLCHINNCHSNEARPETDFPCPQCDKVLLTKNQLSNHLYAAHDEMPEGAENLKTRRGHDKEVTTCHLCDKTFLGRGVLFQHYVDVHPDKPRYTCKFCPKRYNKVRECLRHQRSKHTGERPFQCEYCEKTFACTRTLSIHKENMHSTTWEYSCEHCGKLFPTKGRLRNHRPTHEKSDLKIVCRSCGRSFNHIAGFKRHNLRCHQGKAECTEPLDDTSPETLESLGVRPAEVLQQQQYPIKCHLCWEPVIDMKQMPGHFKKHHPEHKGGILTCQCGKRYERYKLVRLHAMRHRESNKRYHCDQCPLGFFSGSELRAHVERNHVAPEDRRKDHVCEICGLEVATLASLNQHRKNHEAKEQGIRHECKECGKTYAYRKGLLLHVKAEHLKALPFNCPTCGKGFVRQCEMKKHAACHTGEKKFDCPICGKLFGYASGRARHVQEVHRVGGKRKSQSEAAAMAKANKRKVRAVHIKASEDSEEETVSTAGASQDLSNTDSYPSHEIEITSSPDSTNLEYCTISSSSFIIVEGGITIKHDEEEEYR